MIAFLYPIYSFTSIISFIHYTISLDFSSAFFLTSFFTYGCLKSLISFHTYYSTKIVLCSKLELRMFASIVCAHLFCTYKWNTSCFDMCQFQYMVFSLMYWNQYWCVSKWAVSKLTHIETTGYSIWHDSVHTCTMFLRSSSITLVAKTILIGYILKTTMVTPISNSSILWRIT